jgi:hypothetical protein
MTALLVTPLTLCEQLDAMLLGWLERQAEIRRRPGFQRGTAVVRIADEALPEVERLCARWAMTVRRPARGVLAVVEGPARPVEGLAAIYRR